MPSQERRIAVTGGSSNERHRRSNASPRPAGEGQGEGPPSAQAGSLSLMLERCRILRRQATDAERLLWRLLRDRQLAGAKFRRQHPIPPFILDFYCEEERLAVELDGGQHYTERGQQYDRERASALAGHGIRVLRFGNHEILAQTEGVIEALWREVTGTSAEAFPSPCPSPQGEGTQASAGPLKGLDPVVSRRMGVRS